MLRPRLAEAQETSLLFAVVSKSRPKIKVKHLPFAKTAFFLFCGGSKFIRTRNDLEQRRRRRITDAVQPQSDGENLQIGSSSFVQEIDCLPMFFCKLLCDPNNNLRPQAGSVGNDLAKMVVICFLELILDDH